MWSRPFAARCRVPHRLYRWRPDDPDNPYLGFLALADRIIVTSDSMSMLVEATATGKPVFVFDLADPPVPGCWVPTLRAAHLSSGPRIWAKAAAARR